LQNVKATTSSYLQMDVRHWQREGWLRPGSCFDSQWSQDGKVISAVNVNTRPDRIVLRYYYRDNDGLWRNAECSVSITWTSCHYGGGRAWFICPAQGCGRRVAILYSGRIFACRRCYQLAYESQRQPAWERNMVKAQKIRMRLGGSASMFDPFPWKPKRMHRRTYERLRREEALANARAWPAWLLKDFPGTSPDDPDPRFPGN
jgi:hypothetical protein